jgi:hypothetical protein
VSVALYFGGRPHYIAFKHADIRILPPLLSQSKRSFPEDIPSIPVAVLPGNFVPIRCKPPFCNPFLSNQAFSIDVEPGDDVLVDLGMDFPVPVAPAGVGYRFPLSGAINVGTDPLLITYGHGLGPVEPPNFQSKTGDVRRKRRRQ